MEDNSALRQDITDMHYAQLFYVVGHVAIKTLTYIEQLDTELKKSLSDNQQKNMKENGVKKNQEEKEEDELDQMAGGKEAEIEQYSMMLQEI